MAKQLFKSNKNISPPMFRNKFVDFFSRVHFSVPLFIYLPIIGFLTVRAFVILDFSFWPFLGVTLLGLLSWSFSEYAIHRWLFHWHPDKKWAARMHFLVHGVHHDYPNDKLRLVMPPAVSLSLAIIFFILFRLIFGKCWSQPLFIGFTIGYLFYDMTHFAVHHVKFKNKYFKAVQKHHLYHHFKSPEAGFGFTSKFWDWVFRTRQQDLEARKRTQS